MKLNKTFKLNKNKSIELSIDLDRSHYLFFKEDSIQDVNLAITINDKFIDSVLVQFDPDNDRFTANYAGNDSLDHFIEELEEVINYDFYLNDSHYRKESYHAIVRWVEFKAKQIINNKIDLLEYHL